MMILNPDIWYCIETPYEGGSYEYLNDSSVKQELPEGERGDVKLLYDVGGREGESGEND